MSTAEKAIRESNARAERWELLEKAGFVPDVDDALREFFNSPDLKIRYHELREEGVGGDAYFQVATLVNESGPFDALDLAPLKFEHSCWKSEVEVFFTAKLISIDVWREKREFQTDHGPVWLEFFVTEFEFGWEGN